MEPNDLVRRARGGCTHAWGELSTRYRPMLVHYLRRRMGGTSPDIEDVAQDALAKAFQCLDRFDPKYRFSTWLFTIATRMAVDRARSRRRGPRFVALHESDGADHARATADVLADRESVANLWELARRILPERQFTALWLRYGDDLDVADVAKVMGRTQVGVRVLLYRARTHMIRRLRAEASPDRK